VPPRSIENLVLKVQDSTVTVFCKHTDPKKDTFGSAWSKGGATVASNCEILCKTHNRAKGNR